MENSQFETLKPSQNPFSFPPHRRRHLKSETYRTLVRILSHCYDESQCSHALQTVPQEPIQDNGDVELGQVAERDELVGPDRIESKNFFVQKEALVDERTEVIGSQDGGFCHTQMEVDGSDRMNIMEGNEELAHNNSSNLVDSSGDKKQTSDGVVEMINNQEDHFSVPEFHMEEFVHMWQVEVDKEVSIRDVCEDINSSLGIDMIAESSKSIENNEEKSSPVERNASEEVEGEMEPKEMELEKSVSAFGAMNSSLCVTADEEIEDGEISAVIGVHDESMDFLLEDAVLLEEKRVDKVQISEDITDKEEFTGNEQKRGLKKDTECTPFIVDNVDNVGNLMEVELGENNRIEVEDKSEMVVGGETIEAKKADLYDCRLETARNSKQGWGAKEFDSPTDCLENLAPCRKFSGENATENQGTASTEKDAGVQNKKKTRGPLTKERRAKKKQKERIKRAENNRRLGVKRLKLQPVSKPKTVAYCRHYLKGRCQEGEKCKYSHDTIPLTKSKPCRHFARHSCMKGDDCPFDHQLSKYPCNYYLSNGSCSRGADCMFSHEMPVKEGCPLTLDVSKTELKSLSLLGNSNSKKQLNVHGTSHQNVDAKTCSIGISPCKSTERKVAEPILKHAAQAPRGISFLSHRKLSLSDSQKHIQAGSSPKADDGVKVSHQKIHSILDVLQNSNEFTKRTPAVAPQGITFLSLGKSPDDNSSSKKSSRLPIIRDYGIGKSPFGDSSNGKQTASSPKRDDGVKVDNQPIQSASDMVRNLNEMTNKSPPAVVPRGINSLSFGKAPLDDSSLEKQASLHSNVDSLSSVQEKQTAPDKLKIPNAVPWRLSYSSRSCGQSLDRLADGHSESMPSSSQKSLLSNTPSSVQKALQSTLAFAAKFKSEMKMDQSIGAPAVNTDFNKEARSSQNKSMKVSTILDFLYSDSSKTKQ